MSKNVEINIKNESGYEVLYPLTTPEQIIGLSAFLSKAAVTKDELVELGLASWIQLMSWQEISETISRGDTSKFNSGDYKEIVLNGSVGEMSFASVTAYATIIGINHNSSREGTNRLHFQIALNEENTALLGTFQMNTSNTNVGGWNSSYGRNTICNNFRNCLPADLQAVLKTVTKYTDNTGNGGNISSNVTATTDTIFILSEFEVQGIRTSANQYEQNYQARYEWYANHSRVKQLNSVNQWWWNRSPYYSASTNFCIVFDDGNVSSRGASYSGGFAPCFCV